MIATVLIAINLYVTYKLAEFSGAIATKRNSVAKGQFEDMREKALSQENERNG